MTREEFEYAIKSCGCFIYRGQIYYEESELMKAFEDMGLIEQEPKYCDRNICLRNEYNGIGCEGCEVTKSQEPCDDAISRQALLDAFGFSEKTRKWGGDHSGYNTIMLYEIQDVIESQPSVNPQPKTGHCKNCKWWKDSDGVFRRGIGAESQCPINREEVYEGNGYCYMFEPQESEDKE